MNDDWGHDRIQEPENFKLKINFSDWEDMDLGLPQLLESEGGGGGEAGAELNHERQERTGGCGGGDGLGTENKEISTQELTDVLTELIETSEGQQDQVSKEQDQVSIEQDQVSIELESLNMSSFSNIIPIQTQNETRTSMSDIPDILEPNILDIPEDQYIQFETQTMEDLENDNDVWVLAQETMDIDHDTSRAVDNVEGSREGEGEGEGEGEAGGWRESVATGPGRRFESGAGVGGAWRVQG